MSLTQLKNVKFATNERLDLQDVSAISDLKDADLKEILKALLVSNQGYGGERNLHGRVFSGFTGTFGGSGGMVWTFDNIESSAVAPDGSLLEVLVGSPWSTTITAASDKTCYLHAYVLPTDSDSDSRRFRTSVAPYNEFSQTGPTRQTKQVGFYVKYVAPETMQINRFDKTTIIGGVTVSCVALYAFQYRNTGPSISDVVDFRPVLFPDASMPMLGGASTYVSASSYAIGNHVIYNGVYYRSLQNANSGHQPDVSPSWWYFITSVASDVDAFAWGSATRGTMGVYGFRELAVALAKVIKGLVGDPIANDQGWWTYPSHTDSLAGGPAATLHEVAVARGGYSLRNRIAAGKMGYTVGPAFTDFLTPCGDTTSPVELGSFTAGQKIYVREGSYATNGGVDLAGLAYEGDSPSLSKLTTNVAGNCVIVSQYNSDVKNLSLEYLGPASTGANACVYIGGIGAVGEVTFDNCNFISAGDFLLYDTLSSTTKIRFVNCNIDFFGYFLVSVGGNQDFAGRLEFENCVIKNDGGSDFLYHPKISGQLSFKDCTFTNTTEWHGFGLDTVSTSDPVNMKLSGCVVENAVGFIDTSDGIFDIQISDCKFRRTLGTAASGTLLNLSFTTGSFVCSDCTFQHGANIVNVSSACVGASPTHVISFTNCYFSLSYAATNIVSVYSTSHLLTVTFTGCHFDYQGATSEGAKLSTGGPSSPSISAVFQGCVFTASYQTHATPAISLTSGATLGATNGCRLMISGCYFSKNQHSTQLPIRLAGSDTKMSVDASYAWENAAADGGTAITDSGIDNVATGSPRVRDIPTRYFAVVNP